MKTVADFATVLCDFPFLEGLGLLREGDANPDDGLAACGLTDGQRVHGAISRPNPDPIPKREARMPKDSVWEVGSGLKGRKCPKSAKKVKDWKIMVNHGHCQSKKCLYFCGVGFGVRQLVSIPASRRH